YSHDMKLPKSLTEKIAGHWTRKKVKTVEEAMQLALSEQRKEENKGKSSYRKSTTAKNQRKDKLPKWLIEEKKKEKEESADKEMKAQSEPANSNEEKSFEQMLEELKKMQEQKG